MWLTAADSSSQDSQTAIILGVIGLLTAVIVAVVAGVFQVLSQRASRTTPSPPPPNSSPPLFDQGFRDHVVGELAVARQRDDDNDERDDVQDHRIEAIERHLDLDNPHWRLRP